MVQIFLTLFLILLNVRTNVLPIEDKILSNKNDSTPKIGLSKFITVKVPDNQEPIVPKALLFVNDSVKPPIIALLKAVKPIFSATLVTSLIAPLPTITPPAVVVPNPTSFSSFKEKI